MWSALAAVGAHYLVASALLTLFFVMQAGIVIDNHVIFENHVMFFLAFVPAAFAGTAVARRARSSLGAAAFVAYCAIGMCAIVIGAFEEERRVAECGSGCFIVLTGALALLWQIPVGAGLAAGWLLPARGVPSAGGFAVLSSAGAYALTALPAMFWFPEAILDPRVVPYEIVGTTPEVHAALVLCEAAAAAIVLAVRGRGVPLFAAIAAVAAFGLLSVAFLDLANLVHVVLHGWTYWPQSLVYVPLASAAIALAILAPARLLNRVRWVS